MSHDPMIPWHPCCFFFFSGQHTLTHPVCQPQDAIDLTDNDIQVLGNFPLAPRLRSLLLAHNRIAAIQPGVADALPHLTNLTLASNQLAELGDLDPLARLGRLTHLVLLDNPVTKREVSAGPAASPRATPCGRVYICTVLTKGLGPTSTIGIGSSGGVRRCASSTSKRSRTPSGARPKSSLAHTHCRPTWQRRQAI